MLRNFSRWTRGSHQQPSLKNRGQPLMPLFRPIISGFYPGPSSLVLLWEKRVSTARTSFKPWQISLPRLSNGLINLAPFGILGLVYTTIAGQGFDGLKSYGLLLLLLVGTMFFVALVINPIFVYIMIRKNPYPLVFKCLRVSGLTAFFTRSSAANIPVNMKLCKELGLNPDTYSVSIPLSYY